MFHVQDKKCTVNVSFSEAQDGDETADKSYMYYR